jgi:hypothetical protein
VSAGRRETAVDRKVIHGRQEQRSKFKEKKAEFETTTQKLKSAFETKKMQVDSQSVGDVCTVKREIESEGAKLRTELEGLNCAHAEEIQKQTKSYEGAES